jgi:hypothetical protein
MEVVSERNPEKDYLEAPLRCARLGVGELWVFDPGLYGPEVTGGPFRLQIWRLDEEGLRMKRVYAGDGPGYSEELDAWLVISALPARLRLASGPRGPLWPTAAEAEAQRADAAEAELARLRRQLDLGSTSDE